MRVALKPIATLPRSLPSADLLTGEETAAHYERSDVCVVPAAGVIVETMCAIVLATAALEKFGPHTRQLGCLRGVCGVEPFQQATGSDAVQKTPQNCAQQSANTGPASGTTHQTPSRRQRDEQQQFNQALCHVAVIGWSCPVLPALL